MKRYDSYKDSGEQWLGEIPSHWEVLRGKALYSENKSKNKDSNENTVLSLSYGNIILKPNTTDGLVPLKYDSYQIVEPNYIIVRCTDLQNDKVSLRTAISDYHGIITSAYLGLVPNHKIVPKYLHYYLRAWDECKELYRYGSGLRQSLSWAVFKYLNVVLPPIEEQNSMVAHLDASTSKIDTAIAQQQKMIDLLNERKQIIINNAVTKGLNPNVKMKDSGVEWIGEIPEHWKVFKTLYALSMPITDGPHETPELFESGIPFISAEAVSGGKIDFSHMRGYVSESFYKECCKKYIPQLYDVYMIKSGATTGKTAIVETENKFTIWSPLAVFRANTNIINPYFLLNALRATYYIKQVELNWSYGTQQNIGMRILERLLLCVPPVSEQIAIMCHINASIIPIDKAIECANRQIFLLQERKQIIINEVVTGKVKVS